MSLLMRDRAWLALPLVLLLGCNSVPSTFSSSNGSSASEVIAAQPYTTQVYQAVLKQYVDDQGQVNYAALQTNRESLDTFNQSLGGVSPQTYQSWSESEQIAFLINAYNSFTLQSIIDQNPLKDSIRKIPGVWRVRQFPIAGEQKTLDNIEHQTLRKDFQEPRIHMALVCAAKSCPILRNEPYQGDRLNEQLNEQTRLFLSSPHGLKIDRENQNVYLSSIFQWFGEDWQPGYASSKFTGNDNERAVLNFVSQYVSPSDRDYLVAGEYSIKFLDYDWSLNRQ